MAYLSFLRSDIINEFVCVETDLLQDEKEERRQQEMQALEDLAINEKPGAEMAFFESNVERRKFIMENKRTNIMIQALVTFASQQILVVLIMFELATIDGDLYFMFCPLVY